jgi:hypothetical protein
MVKSQSLFDYLTDHFGHFSARLRTSAARLGTFCHLLIVRVLFAGFGTHVAAHGTTLAGRSSERTLPCRKRGSELATFGAVGAKLCRFRMFLASFAEQCQAVLKASIASDLAVSTNLRTLHKVLSVRTARRGNLSDGSNNHR